MVSIAMQDEPVVSTELRAPFPWFGGKRRVADLVWQRFGDVDTYNEPFAGSLAVLLGRPHAPRVETVNDLDVMIANFWRALQADPEGVAYWCDAPVNEADLHARHRWLVSRGRRLALRCMRDPHAFNVKVAGWWVWGQCLWIGSGWCNRVALSQQLPQLSGEGSGSQRGLLADGVASAGLYDYLGALALRLRRVRVCCGDWRRVLTPSVTTYIGITAVFLDAPYQQDLRERCYAEDHDISAAVRAWALEHGDDPKMRIALCGYEDEHGPFMPDTWEKVPWKAHGGYSRSERGVENRSQERIWFSPHCLKATQQNLFEATA